MPPVDLPHHIVGHTSVMVFAVITVVVVSTDGTNHMIYCGQVVSIQVIAFLYDYGGGCVLFLLVLHFLIPGSNIIFIPLPPPPLFHSGEPSSPSPSDSFS